MKSKVLKFKTTIQQFKTKEQLPAHSHVDLFQAVVVLELLLGTAQKAPEIGFGVSFSKFQFHQQHHGLRFH
jgi:hypothetical protein